MADLELTYFDFNGSRGDECRLALAIAGVPFDDKRVKGPDWPALKSTMPFGALPVLDIAGKGRLSQCNAILSYVGRTYGLTPDDAWAAAKQDEVLAAGEELRHAISATLRITDAAEKQAKREALAQTTIPAWGASMQRLLGAGPFVAGERIGVGDLKIFTLVKWIKSGALDHVPTTVLDDSPKVIGVWEAVGKHPAVAAWYAAH
ncbi:MAG: glutathione S-transferase family protein [Nannocystaceae bacterium]